MDYLEHMDYSELLGISLLIYLIQLKND